MLLVTMLQEGKFKVDLNKIFLVKTCKAVIIKSGS